MLELRNVSFSRENKGIITDVSLTVEQGDFMSIVGASGSGKSTLLKLCSDLIGATSGELIYERESYQSYSPVELRKNIGYCFQTPHLFGETVKENVEFPYVIRGVEPDRKRLESLFEALDMSADYMTRTVADLSGGEKQRIALIRSLVFMPKILLLDEVTSALDTEIELI